MMRRKLISHTVIIFLVLFTIHPPIARTQTIIVDTLQIPEFSMERGVYNENFDLTISSTIPNAVIKYTVDCSDPHTSSTAITHNSPVTIHVDPESAVGGRAVTPGFVIRACTIAPDQSISESVTKTYLFINKVAALSPSGIKPGSQWPNPTTSSNPQSIDYGLAQDVLNDSRYKNRIEEALLSIPTISVSTDLKNLFDRNTGIYMNAYSDGINWERPASIELLNPSVSSDENSEGFQINAGLRIRGGASRSGSNRKHAFRVFFRNEYGKAKLKYPLFGKEGVDEFDNIDLRTSQNYAWSFPNHQGECQTMNRDVYTRDLQGLMKQPYTRSRFYHLYLNGVYWGIYQTQERPEASFAESYLGGNKDDYDVIKPGDGWPSPPIEATDGNLDAFRKIWDLCVSGFQKNTNYFKIQGLNEDGTANPNYKNLVDVDNLIDFMIIVFYTGDFDCPISKFGNNNTPRNFYTIYNRNANEGFKFIAHDAEHSLRTTEGEGPGIGLNENRVNIGTLNDYYKMIVTEFNLFHPQWLHFKLSDNAEYKIKFADHVYKYFFNDGLMTSEKATELFNKRADEISTAIIAESARWGDVYHTPSRNKGDDWQIAVDDIVDNYFPYRGDIVLTQFKDTDLFLKINPPSFFHDNKEIFSNTLEVNSGYSLKIQKPTNMNGTIQYTIDGTDPRETGGNVNISTKNGGNEVEITINTTIVIKARLLNGSTWSALHELTLLAGNDVGNFKITEIHYHPLDQDSTSDNEFEFLELKNTGNVPINLSGTSLVEGINYSFPIGTIIETNKFLVLASNRVEFNNRYGFLPFGQYSGQLDNGGEKISFVGSTNDTIFSIIYDDKSPWPETPDGGGYSLVQKELNPTGDLNDPNSWRASYFINGSPGEDDLPTSIGTNEKELPTSSSLYQNFPNPFNPSTIISYRLSVISKVSLKVYDLLGREVATLVNEEQQPEIYNSQFSTCLPVGKVLNYRAVFISTDYKREIFTRLKK